MHRISCPNCGRRLKYADEHQGKKARCRGCGHSFHLPVAIPVPNREPDLGFLESLPDDKQEATSAPRGYGRQQGHPPSSSQAEDRTSHTLAGTPTQHGIWAYWPWFAGGATAVVLLVGLGIWFMNRGTGANPSLPTLPEKTPNAQNKAVPRQQRPDRPPAKLDPVTEKQVSDLITALRADDWTKASIALNGLDSDKGKKDSVGHILQALSIPQVKRGHSRLLPSQLLRQPAGPSWFL